MKINSKVGLEAQKVLTLFESGKLLARGIEFPTIVKLDNKTWGYDFSTWAREYETAYLDRLYSLSSTLLVKGQRVRTYKSVGVLLNSDVAEIEHIAKNDSCSSGNSKFGDFQVYGKSLNSLKELENIIISEDLNLINEVNISIKSDAFVGLFANKTDSKITEAMILLVQKHYEIQTGKTLPVFVYDSEKGTLNEIKYTEEQSNQIINNKLTIPFMPSVNMYYYTENEEKITQMVTNAEIPVF